MNRCTCGAYKRSGWSNECHRCGRRSDRIVNVLPTAPSERVEMVSALLEIGASDMDQAHSLLS